jgi:hypothetical protein
LIADSEPLRPGVPRADIWSSTPWLYEKLGCQSHQLDAGRIADVGRHRIIRPVAALTRIVVYQHSSPAIEKPVGQVASLIEQLGSDDPRRRNAAARTLREKEASVELQLRWALQNMENKPDYPWSYKKQNSPELHPTFSH